MKDWLIKILGGFTAEMLTESFLLGKREAENDLRMKLKSIDNISLLRDDANKILLAQSNFVNDICDILEIKRIY